MASRGELAGCKHFVSPSASEHVEPFATVKLIRNAKGCILGLDKIKHHDIFDQILIDINIV